MTRDAKLWAFLALLSASFAVMLAVVLIGRAGAEPVVQLVDKWQNGIIGVLGMAAGLLFRSSNAENDTASALKTLADKAPGNTPDVILEPGQTAQAEQTP